MIWMIDDQKDSKTIIVISLCNESQTFSRLFDD